MKQVLLGKGIIVEEVPAPALEAGFVLVQNAFSWISSGTESAPVRRTQASFSNKVMERSKHLPRVMASLRVDGVRKTFFRITEHLDKQTGRLGYSSAGRIIAVGRGIQDLAPGDLVACAGMGFAVHAEVIAVPRNLVAPLPPGGSLRAASGATLAAIALQGVRRAGLQIGERGCVLGLGLLGQITLELLRSSGVAVMGFDPDPQRVAAARQAGFDNCHCLTGGKAVKKLSSDWSEGSDAVFITAATEETSICQCAIEMVRKKGQVVVVGAVPLQFDREPFYRREVDFLISCSYGPGRYDPNYELEGHDYPYGYVRWTENRNLQAVLQLMAEGKLDMERLIEREFPIEESEHAFATLTGPAGERPLGVVLTYPPWSADQQDLPVRTVCLRPSLKNEASRVMLGVIGVGSFFQKTHLPNLADLGNRFQLFGICSRVGSVAHDLARRTGASLATSEPADLIGCPDLQAVMICTRHDSHAALACAVLEAGKHVFLEKPLAMTRSELNRLTDATAGNGCYLMVGFNRRFSPHVQRILPLLQERSSPLHVTYRVIADPAPTDSWIYGPSGGGRVIGETCHMFDLFGCLVGEEKKLVEIDVLSSGPSKGMPPGDNFVASFRYDDDSLCTLNYSVLGRKGEAMGKERIELMWDRESYLINDFRESYGTCPGIKLLRKADKGHGWELTAFADYLLGKGTEPISWTAQIRATEMSFIVDEFCRGQGLGGKVVS